MASGLNEPIPAHAVHLCVDMQRMFVEDTPWKTPWAERVLPAVVRLCGHRASRTWFTRFIPAQKPGEGAGTWAAYWRRWEAMTLQNLPEQQVDLARPLQAFVPPAQVFDKRAYSPWFDGRLHPLLSRQTDCLVISGAETDVCVLAAVLGAVDLGYRIVMATDALCSSSDESHDASLRLYHQRYAQQVETAATEEILAAWR